LKIRLSRSSAAPPLTNSCAVCVGVCVYGLGNTVEFSIWRITFRKMSICLIFVVGDENFPYFLRYTNVSHYTTIDSRKNDSCVLQIASTVNVRIFSNYHAGPSNNAGPTSEKLLQFRRSFSSVMDPPRKYYVGTYCACVGECKRTLIALPARYTALAAVTIPIR
jgi:hypothetical protein